MKRKVQRQVSKNQAQQQCLRLLRRVSFFEEPVLSSWDSTVRSARNGLVCAFCGNTPFVICQLGQTLAGTEQNNTSQSGQSRMVPSNTPDQRRRGKCDAESARLYQHSTAPAGGYLRANYLV